MVAYLPWLNHGWPSCVFNDFEVYFYYMWLILCVIFVIFVWFDLEKKAKVNVMTPPDAQWSISYALRLHLEGYIII